MLRPEEYVVLKDRGIDVDACKLNFREVSVACEDLSLYRKALRVKIRALIKSDDKDELRSYVDLLYSLAQFARYLYGFHSCNSRIEIWQEKLARSLQGSFDESRLRPYDGQSWLSYQDVDAYSAFFKCQYKERFGDLDTGLCIQDEKPFLNPKDKAHFDKCL
jgi:hypothetical protein